MDLIDMITYARLQCEWTVDLSLKGCGLRHYVRASSVEGQYTIIPLWEGPTSYHEITQSELHHLRLNLTTKQRGGIKWGAVS